MVVALARALADETRLLEQVRNDLRASDKVLGIELDLDELTLHVCVGGCARKQRASERSCSCSAVAWEERRTKRDELSLRPVLAFPKASSTGTDSSTIVSTFDWRSVRAARNCKISLVHSVFPAPDSPLQRDNHNDKDKTTRARVRNELVMLIES